ncbi:MAG: transcription-repair coupling factor, partial [Clostridia bacterium]|nr:transcription-repair coupling factor [Clostridia bacterium]
MIKTIHGVQEGQKPFIAAEHSCPLLVITRYEKDAAAWQRALTTLLDKPVGVIPPPSLVSGAEAATRALAGRRAEALLGLAQGITTVACVEAALAALPAASVLEETRISLEISQVLPPEELVSQLVKAGYEPQTQAESPGQFARRGGIVDCVTAEGGIRVSWFGDEVDSIRTFDPATQRMIEVVQSATVPPAGIENGEAILADYLPDGAIVIIDEPIALEETAGYLYTQALELYTVALEQFADENAAVFPSVRSLTRPEHAPESPGLVQPQDLFTALRKQNYIELTALPGNNSLTGSPGQNFHGRMDMLAGEIKKWQGENKEVRLYAGNESKAKNIESVLIDNKITAKTLPLSLNQGFVSEDWKLVIITENELYGTRAIEDTVKQKPRRSLEESRRIFADLQPGDYVVHEQHGVAKFQGMVHDETVGVLREYMLLEYKGGDRLYVPTEQLDRVRRYIGGSDEAIPPLSQMGGAAWKRTRDRVRSAVAKVAEGLVELYAKRQTAPGFAFSADTPWQTEFEQRFPYEETPDQARSIIDVKTDMEQPHPMDRLLCGDVGYGKTEVAMRAAFKAVQDGKQAAILVPTTILCQQHFLSFSQRFAGYPVTVGMLSRFRTAAEQKQLLKELKAGACDVVIGTHALLSASVEFKDLGLLVVDEEQRFGVNHKEKIKRMRANVDVLTLTATPIPRTLHMSMVGIRDLSVIDTPPEDRRPVQTFVMEYTDYIAREAIMREIGRGGQVYFLFNRVMGIDALAEKLRLLVPNARIAVGHGQMPQEALEGVTLAFVRGEVDVLLCTTIIENGLDIPNANTLIVYDADRLGLAQLYQLRGRVGRSSRVAYAYLTYRQGREPGEEARKRLAAIREFTQLGSGFRIAMRDLEIRGAGNVLGAEQSGQIAAVGYDLYCRLVEEEVRKLQGHEVAPEAECVLDLKVDAMIPEDYIPDARRRLAMYRRLASVTSAADIDDAIDELTDRYGDPPQMVTALCKLAYLRACAIKAGVVGVSHGGAGTSGGLGLVLRFGEDGRADAAKLL